MGSLAVVLAAIAVPILVKYRPFESIRGCEQLHMVECLVVEDRRTQFRLLGIGAIVMDLQEIRVSDNHNHNRLVLTDTGHTRPTSCNASFLRDGYIT